MALRINPGYKSLNLYFNQPTNAYSVDDVDTGTNIQVVQNDIRTDLQGLKIWIRATSWEGGQPVAGELYYDGPFQGQLTIDKLSATDIDLLEDNKTYYIKYAFISKLQPSEYTILPVTANNISTELTSKTLDVSLPIQGYLTRDPIEIPTDENGDNPTFTDATGQFKIFRYSDEVTTSGQVTFAIKTVDVADPITGNIVPEKVTTGGANGTIDEDGNYEITAITALTGTITFTATWTNPTNPDNILVIEKVLNIGKRRPGQTAPLVAITASPGLAFALVENTAGTTIYPQDGIVLSASTSNIPGQIEFTWTYDPGGLNLPIKGTGQGYTDGLLNNTSLNTDESELTVLPAFFSGMTTPIGKVFKVVAESTIVGNDVTAFDLFSIYYLKEGSDAVYMGLQNENQTVTVDKNNQYIGTQPIIESQALVVEGINFVPANRIQYSIDFQDGFDNTLVINNDVNTPIAGKPKGYIQATAIEATKAYGIIKAVVAGKTFLRTLTVTRIKDGTDATNIDAQLTNDFRIIPTLPDGTNGDYIGASTTIEVYQNGVLQTSGYTFYVSELAGGIVYTNVNTTQRNGIGEINGSLTAVDGRATLAVVSMAGDSGYLDITAKKIDDQQLFTERFNLSKNKDGDPAVVYELRSNTNTIAKASPDYLIDGVHTPSTINFKVYKIKGNEEPIEFGGDPLYYAQWNSPSQPEPTTYTVVPAGGNLPAVVLANNSDVTSVNAKLMYKKIDGSYILFDKEEIGVVYKGSSGQATVTSYAFIRTDSNPPATPTGGNFFNPNPTGPTNAGGIGINWSDGIPADNGKPLWISIRTFTSDGLTPQDATWSAPSKVAAPSQSARFQFSENSTGPWSTTPSTTSVYAKLEVSTDNGITWNQSGNVFKIKGENGSPGSSVDIVFKRSNTQPTVTGNTNPPDGTWSSTVSGATGTAPLWSSVGYNSGSAANTWIWEAAIRIEGTDGLPGNTVAEVSAFARSSTVPPTPSGGSYTFGATNPLIAPTSASVTWYASIPAGTDPIWESRAVAAITGTSGTDATLTWSTPVKTAENGLPGTPGTSVDIVFKRSTTVLGPSDKPANSASSPPAGGWFSTVAETTGTAPLYSSTGYKNGTTWTWNVPVRVEGATGSDGQSIAEISVFTRVANAVSVATPANGVYSFTSKSITTVPISAGVTWYASIPAGTDPIWESRAVAVGQATGNNTNTLTWSTPVKTAENGAPARGVDISGALAIKYNSTTGYSPTSLTLTALPQNIVPTSYSWSSPNGTASFSSLNSATTTMTPANTSSIQVKLVVSDGINTAEKTITIAVASDGAIGPTGPAGIPAKSLDILGTTTGSFKLSGTTYSPANTGTLIANPQNLVSPSYTWTVSGGTFSGGITTSYSSSVVATPNSNSTMTITLTVLSEGVYYNKTIYYSINSDGTGVDGRRTATGVVYKTAYTTDDDNTPGGPSATSFTFTTGVFTGLDSSGWSKNAPVFQANNSYRYWVATFTAVENTSGSNTSSGTNLTFGTPSKAIGFSGLVTFSSATQVTDGTNTIAAFNSSTQIDGGQITTGTISANRLQLGQNSGASRIVLTDQKIEVYEGNNLRVRIGNLA
jgi:hypothetical protein